MNDKYHVYVVMSNGHMMSGYIKKSNLPFSIYFKTNVKDKLLLYNVEVDNGIELIKLNTVLLMVDNISYISEIE